MAKKLTKTKVWRPYFRSNTAPHGLDEADVTLSVQQSRHAPGVKFASLLTHVGQRKTYVQIDIHPEEFEAIATLMFEADRAASLKAFAKAILSISDI